ncbi:hypothetical protein R4K89_05765 [Brachyspira intermedia]|uniref:hypothetical protein n=1 Tax=Brachyspira intermedia TaxID=84377 RepID=UPI0030060DD3
MNIEDKLKEVINKEDQYNYKNISNYYNVIKRYNNLVERGLTKERGYNLYNSIENSYKFINKKYKNRLEK